MLQNPSANYFQKKRLKNNDYIVPLYSIIPEELHAEDLEERPLARSPTYSKFSAMPKPETADQEGSTGSGLLQDAISRWFSCFLAIVPRTPSLSDAFVSPLFPDCPGLVWWSVKAVFLSSRGL